MSAPSHEPKWSPSPSGLMTIDRGNTTLDCQLWGAAGNARHRLEVDDRDALARLLDEGPQQVVAASVVADGLDVVERIVKDRGIPMQVAGRDLPCPLALAYPRPESLGVDRWVSAFAAHRGFGGSCIVIDCGTAVTIDLVDNEGTFRGGMIAPGAATMAFGLAARAPALPGADLSAELQSVPTDSEDAVNAGVVHAFCGLIDRGVRRLAEGAGVDGPWLVITGGDAALYQRHGVMPVQHVPDLVHRGLAELWADRSR